MHTMYTMGRVYTDLDYTGCVDYRMCGGLAGWSKTTHTVYNYYTQ